MKNEVPTQSHTDAIMGLSWNQAMRYGSGFPPEIYDSAQVGVGRWVCLVN